MHVCNVPFFPEGKKCLVPGNVVNYYPFILVSVCEMSCQKFSNIVIRLNLCVQHTSFKLRETHKLDHPFGFSANLVNNFLNSNNNIIAVHQIYLWSHLETHNKILENSHFLISCRRQKHLVHTAQGKVSDFLFNSPVHSICLVAISLNLTEPAQKIHLIAVFCEYAVSSVIVIMHVNACEKSFESSVIQIVHHITPASASFSCAAPASSSFQLLSNMLVCNPFSMPSIAALMVSGRNFLSP